MSILFWILLILGILFVYSQISTMTGGFNKRYKKLYKRKQSDRCSYWPNGSVFGIAWTIIYALIVVSFLSFTWNLTPSHFSDFSTQFNLFDVTLLLFIINIILNKIWSLVFMEGTKKAINNVIGKVTSSKKPPMYPFVFGILIILLLILTGVTICILLGIQHQWVAFGFFVPYNLWLCYALFLNYDVYIFVKANKKINTSAFVTL